MVVTKPVEPVGKDIGFLPGTLEEKMMPWLAPIQDNLQFLMGDDKMTLDMYHEKGQIEVEAMTFIRGRSISNAFIVIDEVQNMTQHEIKTVLTRVGEGTKIVLTGDIEQIDNVYIDATNNGLSYVVERLKNETITEGMIPKINACLDAVNNGVTAVGIINGTKKHSCLWEIFSDKGAGTLIRR